MTALLDLLPVLAMLLASCPVVLGNVIGCCCAACAICSDDFNRSDDTDIDTGSACGWTESSGTWAISSNQLVCTAAGIVICDATHPDTPSPMFAEVAFKHSSSGSSCDVLVSVVDSSNYLYARYTAGSNTVTLRANAGGSHSTLAGPVTVTIATNTTYTAKVCTNPANSTITAFLDGTGILSAIGANAGSNNQAGLGASGSGTATFDNFTFSKAYHSADAPDCEECQIVCGGCGNAPAEMLLHITNAWDNDLVSCDPLLGEWVLAFVGRDPTSGKCRYEYEGISPAVNYVGSVFFDSWYMLLSDINVEVGLYESAGPAAQPIWFNSFSSTGCETHANRALTGGGTSKCAVDPHTAPNQAFSSG